MLFKRFSEDAENFSECEKKLSLSMILQLGRLAWLSFLVLSLGYSSIQAQDLNARVQVLSPQVQNTNKRALEVLQKAITDFLNNRTWSANRVLPQERIDCSFVITITAWNGSSDFNAQAQIVSTRPVFNTSYNSPVLNISDDQFNFSYTEGQLMDYSDQQYMNN